MTPRTHRRILYFRRKAWPWARDFSIFVLAVIGSVGWLVFFYGLGCWARGAH